MFTQHIIMSLRLANSKHLQQEQPQSMINYHLEETFYLLFCLASAKENQERYLGNQGVSSTSSRPVPFEPEEPGPAEAINQLHKDCLGLRRGIVTVARVVSKSFSLYVRSHKGKV